MLNEIILGLAVIRTKDGLSVIIARRSITRTLSQTQTKVEGEYNQQHTEL